MTPGASQLRYGVIGHGRLGAALVDALRRTGRGPAAVVYGSAAAGQSESVGDLGCSLADLPRRVDLIFVTVPDERLFDVVQPLAVGSNHAVVHCSGATDLSVLAIAAQQGAQVGCFHPLQAFPAGSDAQRFAGITIGIEAAEPLFSELSQFAQDLGARTLSLHGVNRARYHAAAVFASNYAVALMEAAACAFEAAGLPANEAAGALGPLMKGAVAAMAERPLAEALTGPVARGDVNTVRDHLQALADDPPLQQAYAALGLLLLRLERPVDAEQRRRLRELFEGYVAEPNSISGR